MQFGNPNQPLADQRQQQVISQAPAATNGDMWGGRNKIPLEEFNTRQGESFDRAMGNDIGKYNTQPQQNLNPQQPEGVQPPVSNNNDFPNFGQDEIEKIVNSYGVQIPQDLTNGQGVSQTIGGLNQQQGVTPNQQVPSAVTNQQTTDTPTQNGSDDLFNSLFGTAQETNPATTQPAPVTQPNTTQQIQPVQPTQPANQQNGFKIPEVYQELATKQTEFERNMARISLANKSNPKDVLEAMGKIPLERVYQFVMDERNASQQNVQQPLQQNILNPIQPQAPIVNRSIVDQPTMGSQVPIVNDNAWLDGSENY